MSLVRSLKTFCILLPILTTQPVEAAPRPRPMGLPVPQGIVLTGGKIVLDFGDGQSGLITTDLNRMDQLVWSGGTGALAGQNLIQEVIENEGSTDAEDIFGASSGVYGDPQTVGPGYAAVASHQTATTLTTTTTGTGYGAIDNEPIASTDYEVFPAGDSNENEFRVSRTINFTTSTPVYQTSAVRVYIPDLVDTYDFVLYPNAAGNIVSVNVYSSDSAEVTDWNGKWFADDDGNGTGMVVFRDATSQAPAELVIDTEEESEDNLTSIGLLQPASGFKSPVTETEWVCLYDPSTWTAADQQAGNLPKGCAQMDHVVTPAPVITLSLDFSAVAVGQAAHLTWSTTNAAACTASGAWSGSEPTSGTAVETPNAAGSFTYTLTCTGSGGSSTAAAQLTVNAAPTISFSATTSHVTLGQSDTLNWSSTNATSCTASGAWTGGEKTSGSASVTPTSVGTSAYTLTCTGPGGSAQASVSLVAAAVAVVLSGHVGGGGALGWQWLCALAILTLIARASMLSKRNGRTTRTLAAWLTLGVAASVGPVRAQQAADLPQPYVGVRAGQANYQYSPADLVNALGAGSSEIDGATLSRHQFGGMLYGGVPIFHSLMLEVGYAQLGQFPLSIKATSSDTASLANRILAKLAPAGHGITAGFALPLQFGPTVGIEPRLSALYYQSKQVVATSNSDYHNDLRGLGIDAGISVTFHVFGPLHVGLGADCMHMTQACNVLLYTGQIEYRFGRRH